MMEKWNIGVMEGSKESVSWGRCAGEGVVYQLTIIRSCDLYIVHRPSSAGWLHAFVDC